MPEKTILDYGCGLGGNCPFLEKRGRYFGVDILPKNIEYAKKRYGAEKFSLLVGGLVPAPENSFDEVHIYDVLEHVEDFDGTINEISRVTKKGGSVFVVVPAKVSEKALLKIRPDYFKEIGHLRIVDPQALSGAFKDIGFALVKTSKVRGVEAIMLALLFLLHKNKRMVAYQTGSPEFSRWAVAFIWLFDTRLFRTKLKYLFFIYWLTLPFGWLISRFFPKSNYFVFKKQSGI